MRQDRRVSLLVAALFGAQFVAIGEQYQSTCFRRRVGDSVAQVGGEDAPPVMDVAEIMLAAVQSVKPKPVTAPARVGNDAGGADVSS